MKKLLIIPLLVILLFTVTGCRKPYDVPEFKTITPSQTAFLIPLVGKTTEQKGFASEAFLENAKVATKRVQIPHMWVQDGRRGWEGKYLPAATLIVVERKPVTREWTEDTSGTSAKNQGIVADTVESIAFMSRMNVSAQIDEPEATGFLYRYNNKPLEAVMDTEIRARVEAKFVEVVAKMGYMDVVKNKSTIMEEVRKDVIPFFKERGINITVLGLKGEFTWLDKNIQAAINKRAIADNELQAQSAINKKKISEAEANKQALEIMRKSGADQYQLQLMQLQNQAAAIAKWNGGMPQFMGAGNNMLFSIPSK